MTRRKRETSREERELFRDSFRDVRPVRSNKDVSGPHDTPQPMLEPEKSNLRASSARSGLDGATAERLRRGRLEPEARLDLHGMTEAAAHRALQHFVRSSHVRGLRLILVVTGKGLNPEVSDAPFDLGLDRRSRGILRTMAPRWLKEPELSSRVADVRVAHRRHGGDGALYVYLRKALR